MSLTVTTMSIPSLTTSRHRGLSLSLLSPSIKSVSQPFFPPPPVQGSSPLLTLPAELTLDILELSTTLSTKPKSSKKQERHGTKQHSTILALALTCRALAPYAARILYRDVEVHNLRQLEVLYRTATSSTAFSSPMNLASPGSTRSSPLSHVKSLIIHPSTVYQDPQYARLAQFVPTVLSACVMAHTVQLPSLLASFASFVPAFTHDGGNKERDVTLAFDTYPAAFSLSVPLTGVTKLTVASPSLTVAPTLSWSRYTATTPAFVPPLTSLPRQMFPNVKEVRMPRRAGGNEDNDDVFVRDVVTWASEFTGGQQPVEVEIAVYEPLYRYGEAGVQDSTLWNLSQAAAEEVRGLRTLSGRVNGVLTVVEGKEADEDKD